MIENIIVYLIIGLCVFLLGRKYYRQWRQALDPNQSIGCSSCGCACDEKNSCNLQTKIKPQA